METAGNTAGMIERIRQDFLESGLPPGNALAPHIRRSWERCLTTTGKPVYAEPVPHSRLAERRDASEWLLRSAQPELDAMAEHVVTHGCVLILSDASGLILEEIGSPEFLPKAHRVSLQPGADWSEDLRATNAIGTALIERAPVMVLGAEHLLPENSGIGCAAAPIFSEHGELMGVLDISGDSVGIGVHALGLVRMAATQVEHRLMCHRYEAGTTDGALIRFHHRPLLLGTTREALLSVIDGRIAGANRAALELLGGDWQRWIGQPVETVFGTNWRAMNKTTNRFEAPRGDRWAVRVDTPHSSRKSVAPGWVATMPARDRAPANIPLDDQVLNRARKVIDAGLGVLITGETGVGKDVFARRLHAASRRAAQPMVAVNCAALPEGLIEAELFGYEDGAFTGARRSGNAGRLREAHGGTLFLDEIGDMPLALQARLLRVLEERRVRPLGGARDIDVDFALVCASHRDLAAEVRAGRFREDLFYRLRGFEVQLPALRDRDDRRAFIEQLFDELGAAAQGNTLEEPALDVLDAHPWPGNIRELVSVLKTILALVEPYTIVQVHDLPALHAPAPARAPASSLTSHAVAAPSSAGPDDQLATLTEHAMRQMLAQHGGNVTAAARALGIHRSTLHRHLQKNPSAFGL